MLFADINRARCLRRLFYVFTLTTLCAAGATAQSNAAFAGRSYKEVGFKHVAADFNGDLRPDVATAGVGVRVMLNNGDGSFRTPVELAAGVPAQDVAAGDLNGDGRLDLVVTNNDPQVGLLVLLGNGDGTFAAPVNYPNDTGFDSPSVVLSDFDHDNRLDALVAHETACFTAPCRVGDSLSLWRGLGDGTFQPPRQIQVGVGPARVAVADFNNDIHPDLAVAAAFGKLIILLGLGDGTFRQLADVNIVAGVDNTDVDVADFNNDGVPDLVVAADADHRTVFLLGNGDGSFTQSASVSDTLQERVGEQAVADFNGDGFQDAAIGMALCCAPAGDGSIGILYGTGAGTFRPVVRYLVPGFVINNAGGYLIAADLSADGRADIALQIRGNNPGLTVLLNTTGRAPAPLALGSVVATPASVVGSNQAEINISLAPGAVAPSGSTTLNVKSSRNAVVTVPSTVRIIAGMTNVRFRVNTTRVTTPQNVTVTVSSNRLGSRSVVLTVTPPTDPLTLGSVEVSPAGVFGGRDAAGSVNLTTGNVAPTGGAFVSLTNDNPALVTTPSEVVIPAGQSSASFPIQTRQTGVTASVNITGQYGGTTRSATLIVSAPTNSAVISTLTLTPSSVTGGSTQGVRLVVTLDQAAPSERATISLSSSNPALVPLPPSMQIETGFTSSFVDFATRAVSAPTQVTINATYGGSSQSVVLTLTPQAAPAGPTLGTLSLSPSTVTGGGNSQGTVTLSAPAQAATVVNLSSGSALATVPASVTVAAGASSATFNVATASVASPATVSISAALNGATRSATLNINPPAATADTVGIQRAEYDASKRTLRVEATSNRTNATLQVFVTSTNQLIGTLTPNNTQHSGELGVATNPQNITVRSSLGGSATRSVVLK